MNKQSKHRAGRSALLVCGCVLGLAAMAAPPSPAGNGGEEIVCLIEPSMEVNVGTPVDGVLEVVNADRGDLVKPGQLLARLNVGVENAAIEYQVAKSQFGERKVARTQDLNARKLVSDQELDELVTEQKLAELELQQRQELLRLRSITSPIKGVIVDRFRNRGDLVKQERIFRIAQIDPLHVETIVPASYFGRIRPGQTYSVKPQFSDGMIKAKVSNVDRVIDPASGTFRVRLVLPNQKLAVPSGQRCSVNF
jgi:RND family efflux transporter MFP subunit